VAFCADSLHVDRNSSKLSVGHLRQMQTGQLLFNVFPVFLNFIQRVSLFKSGRTIVIMLLQVAKGYWRCQIVTSFV